MTKIGLLGGIGPEATGHFYLKLIKKLQGSGRIKSNSDYPQIIINSIPAKELITGNENTIEYEKGLQELDFLSPDFIAIICNTAHIHLEELRHGIKAPIIDLRTVVNHRMKNDGIKTTTIFGTGNAVENKLYNLPVIKTIQPSHKEQETINRAIFEFNRTGKIDKEVFKIAEGCLNRGAEKILISCTELAIIFEKSELPTINTMDILLDEIIQKCNSKSF